ncbi:MAG: hypothetical protein WED10_03540 [Brumimicrobium sp.]
MKIIVQIFTLLVFLGSCGMPMGDRIDADKLSVYYLDGVPKEKAIKFAKYWKNNDLIGDEAQVIQLEKLSKNTIGVKLIEEENYHDEGLSIHEESLLQSLERDLEKEVFKQDVTLIITDNTLRPIERE